MGLDLSFSEWLVQFNYFNDLAIIFSGRVFSGTLIAGIGIYFYRIKKLKIFFFICLATGLGDLLGNFLKDLFLQPRPCFSHIYLFKSICKCCQDITVIK